METTKELFIRCLDKGSQEGAEALDFSFLLCDFLVRPACFYTVQLGASIRDQFYQCLHTGGWLWREIGVVSIPGVVGDLVVHDRPREETSGRHISSIPEAPEIEVMETWQCLR